jgi:hypothetical protein
MSKLRLDVASPGHSTRPASLRAGGTVCLSEIVGLPHLGPGNYQARQGDDYGARDEHQLPPDRGRSPAQRRCLRDFGFGLHVAIVRS